MRTETRRTSNSAEIGQVDPAEGRFYDLVNPSAGEAYTIGSELAWTKG